jgi:triacylglycerol lipase
MSTRLVFLVPGFFGFTSVGAVSYFEDVEQALGRALRRRGVQARIVRCIAQPTASIPRRADALRRQVLRNGSLKARELHFVGHSTTGGLDVRMLLTPGVKIARGDSEERIARRSVRRDLGSGRGGDSDEPLAGLQLARDPSASAHMR